MSQLGGTDIDPSVCACIDCRERQRGSHRGARNGCVFPAAAIGLHLDRVVSLAAVIVQADLELAGISSSRSCPLVPRWPWEEVEGELLGHGIVLESFRFRCGQVGPAQCGKGAEFPLTGDA